MQPTHRRPARRLDQRGIALPLALLALVAISLMVTTALVTSSTEAAIGEAYGDAARSLYTAERAVTDYVGDFVESGESLEPIVTTHSLGADGDVQITVVRMQHQDGDEGGWTRVFSVMAEPMRGDEVRGRAVVAMVRQVSPPPASADLNITSAITLGGDLDVNGNAFTVTGRDSSCMNGLKGVDAVRTADSSNITVNNAGHWDNFVGINDAGTATKGQASIDNSGLTKEQLAWNVLGEQSLETMIAALPISKKWGPKFGRPAWDGFLHDEEGNVAVVDGNGGIIDLLGGKGMLIIVNGDVRMTGNAKFEGIIIVEGNFSLKGTPTVMGALISLDTDTDNVIDLDASAIANGHITVQFNKCRNDAALAAFANSWEDAPAVMGSSFAWLEVVR